MPLVGTVSKDVTANTVKITSSLTVPVATAPSAADAIGQVGEIRFGSGYIYVCVAANTWKRVAISTW